jgi:hypothetical protein
MAEMTIEQITSFCSHHLLQAVEVTWYSKHYDWRMFRIERVWDDRVAFTGMTDADRHHDGSFFWCQLSDIKSIKLRSRYEET